MLQQFNLPKEFSNSSLLFSPYSKLPKEKSPFSFSKTHTQDFIKKSAIDPIYSLNTLGLDFSMASIAETLIGKKMRLFCFEQENKTLVD